MENVVIIGGGIAGNMAAAYLRRKLPSLSVTIVDRERDKLPIVGESTVEISANFIRELGLSRHLVEEHYPKYALTYYYKVNRGDPADRAYYVSESPNIPPYPSFQINRFRFDEAIKSYNRANDVEYIKGKITDVKLSEGQSHSLELEADDNRRRTLRSRWIIDASGRARLLARKLGLRKTPHVQRDAFWFRLADFDEEILREINDKAIKKSNHAYDPYYATHHFFGNGNWVWCIPLKDRERRNLISVGVVYRKDICPFEVKNIDDFRKHVGTEHGSIIDMVDSGTVLDSNKYTNYMYESTKRYSAQRWAIIGDAADTVDALYSLGLAISSVAISQVGELIRQEINGELTEEFVQDADSAITNFHRAATQDITKLYEVMEDSFQTAHRQQLTFLISLHIGLPYMYSGLMYDPVGLKLWNKFGAPEIADKSADLQNQLISHVASRRNGMTLKEVSRIQSSFVLNYRFYETMKETNWAKSISSMHLYLFVFRMRLLAQSGIKGVFWLRQHVEAGKDLMVGLIVGTVFRGTTIRANPVIKALLGVPRRRRRVRGVRVERERSRLRRSGI